MDRQRMLDALEAQVGLVRYALDEAAPRPDALGAPVPTCPGWTVRDLVVHLGAVHRWAAATLADANPAERTRGLGAAMESAPEALPALAEWYSEAASALVERLETTDPAAPAWTFDGSGTAAFWLRRQLHETVVHRFDLENALTPGAETPLNDDVAEDGLAEFVDFVAPAGRAAHAESPGYTPVTLELTVDGGPEFTIDGGGPRVGLSGPGEALLFCLWGRVGPDDERLTVYGDRDTLERALAAGLAV